METLFKRIKTIFRSGPKSIDHLNWSAYDSDFLEDLQEQPIRQMVFQQIQDDFEENRFSNILEVGFGSASQYKKMKSFFDENSISYTGIDYTAHFVEKAKLKFPDVNWEHGDVRNLPFEDDSFDYVFIYHVLEHQNGYEDVQKAIQELGRVAKRNIMIIWFKKPTFAHETRGNLQKDGFYYYKYSVADICKAIWSTDYELKKIQVKWNSIWYLRNKNVQIQKNYSFDEKISKLIKEECQKNKFSNILEVDFGNSVIYQILGQYFNENQISYSGIDNNEKHILKAKKEFPDFNWIQNNFANENLGHNSFDLIIINQFLESLTNEEEYKKSIKKICTIAKEKIVVIWSSCPKILIESKSQVSFEITASDIFKDFFKNDYQLQQVAWEEKCIWVFEPNDHKTY